MTSPKDLVPNKYEVLKLKTGTEICGMTRDTPKGTEVILPMVCQLNAITKKETLATFYPYAPLSKDPAITIQSEQILHRSNMNEQFIPFYDEASSQWQTMVEEGRIPLTTKSNIRGLVEQTLEDMMLNSAEDYSDVTQDDIDLYDIAKGKKVIH
jgi:hypothetical protein